MSGDFSRRTVLGIGTGAALAAGAMVRAAPLQQPVKKRSDSLGIALVGIGLLTEGQLLPGLTRTKGVHLAALVSGHPEKAQRYADQYGLPHRQIYNYDNYDRLADDPSVQIVYIVLPNFMHAEYTIRALKAGKHVLCEKPMAVTVHECEQMIAAAKTAKRHLMIAYRCQYEPLNLTAMRLMREQALGRPRIVHTDMGRQTSLQIPSDAWRLDMAKSGGGALADMGIYGINAARYLLNEEPVEVRAWARTDHDDPRFKTVEDLINWQMRFPSGAIGEGSTSFSQPGTMAYQVVGETTRLVADPGCFYNGNKLSLIGGNLTTPHITEIDQFAREMDWMGDVVRGTAPMVSPGEEGMQDMRLMHAMLESVAKDGATIATDWGYRRAVDPAAVVDVPAIT
ncbi:Gfo/Idh/MocA family oxidoreductase [Stakelama sediminis]|uniref:Putative dehydrogenase n=1 Tax=Stakelama sediminis TaxID=463200 RepID=A0A840YY36_9SPHN|nr:Gfo/Idh/MocA family oxidoreductase [Stakelama sediminis]MBB5718563.1 putative dehydrogenase [Stakelama sediminis]